MKATPPPARPYRRTKALAPDLISSAGPPAEAWFKAVWSSAFAILSLMLGTGYALLLPPLQAPDEGGHYERAYELSEGACMVAQDATVPDKIAELPLRYPAHIELQRSIHPAEIRAGLAEPLNRQRRVPAPFHAANGYSCVPYLPAAAGMAMGRIFGASALQLMYLGRLASLVLYTILVLCALWLLPGFQPLLFCLAVMPMTLHQAASITTDSLTLGVTFLFTAYVLHLAFGPVERITARHMFVLGALVVLMTLCKSNVWLALAVCLIPPKKLAGRKRWLMLAAAILVTCLIAAGLAQTINHDNISRFLQSRIAMGIDVTSNLRFVRQHPILFAEAIGNSVRVLGPTYAKHFVGTLGPLYVRLPRWLVAGYLLIVLAAAVLFPGKVRLSVSSRILITGVTIASVLSTFVLLWGFEATGAIARSAFLHDAIVPGVQGRYFIPFGFLSLTVLGSHRFQAAIKGLNAGMWIVSALILMGAAAGCWIGLAEMRAAYYPSQAASDNRAAAGCFLTTSTCWVRTSGQRSFSDTMVPCGVTSRATSSRSKGRSS